MRGQAGGGAEIRLEARRGLLDDGVGERRGVVLVNDRPERLMIERIGDPPSSAPGARVLARLARIDRRLGAAFLDLGDDVGGFLPLKGPAAGLTEGSAAVVEVLAGPRREKSVVVRFLEAGEGAVRLLRPAPSLEDRLRTWTQGEPLETGSLARAAADEAEAEALAVEHSLLSGGRVFIEPTRALTAVDVDLAAAPGGDARRLVARVNAEALAAVARLLRLKGLGGLVVIDLAGRGHDGPRLLEIARAAFAPDGEGVSFGAISRFGAFELALPWRQRPISDVLLGADGQISITTSALRLMRLIESQAGPGERLQARCAPEVAAAAARLSEALIARIGRRFLIEPVGGMKRDQLEVYPG